MPESNTEFKPNTDQKKEQKIDQIENTVVWTVIFFGMGSLVAFLQTMMVMVFDVPATSVVRATMIYMTAGTFLTLSGLMIYAVRK